MTPVFPLPEDWNTEMEKIQLQLLPKRRQTCTAGGAARAERDVSCFPYWAIVSGDSCSSSTFTPPSKPFRINFYQCLWEGIKVCCLTGYLWKSQTKPKRTHKPLGELPFGRTVLTALTCQSPAQASQLLCGQVKLGRRTERLLPAATGQKGAERLLVGAAAGKHEACRLVEALLQQVLPVSNADVLGQGQTRGQWGRVVTCFLNL